MDRGCTLQTAVELVVNGLTLRGMLHEPADTARPPLVGIYHGFTGQKRRNTSPSSGSPGPWPTPAWPA